MTSATSTCPHYVHPPYRPPSPIDIQGASYYAKSSKQNQAQHLHPNDSAASSYNPVDGHGDKDRGPSNGANLRKMTNTVRASNKAAILSVGEELRLLLHEEEPPIIKDRRYHLKIYQDCFVGHDMVDWLLKKGEVESRDEAVTMMKKLLDNGVIHHVCDDHTFKDDKLFYRFRKDDGTYKEPPDTAILAKGQRLYSRVRGDGSNLIQDRKYHLATYKQSFIGRDFVDWLIHKGEATTRDDAVVIGKQLLDAGVFKHVCEDHHFKDEYLFYRFKNDEKEKSQRLSTRVGLRKSSRKTQGQDDDNNSTNSENRGSGASWDSSSEIQTPPRTGTPDSDEYQQMHRASPQVSPHTTPQPNITVQQPPFDIRTNGSFSSSTSTGGYTRPAIEELTNPNGRFVKRRIDVVSDPVGYGFVIRGSRPVYIHTIDPSGPATAAGLQVGEYLYSVNGQNVLHASHTDAARIILMGPSTASLVTFIEKDRLDKN